VPTDRDVRSALDGGTALQRALAARAIHAASRRIHNRLLVPDRVSVDEELASEIDVTATALSGLARAAGRSA
jgi:hypothetical protein